MGGHIAWDKGNSRYQFPGVGVSMAWAAGVQGVWDVAEGALRELCKYYMLIQTLTMALP